MTAGNPTPPAVGHDVSARIVDVPDGTAPRIISLGQALADGTPAVVPPSAPERSRTREAGATARA
ncbi:hypothetical protein PV350_01275 [Streptomyces sp. PA03-6a]|nr:hypothetical protein [Streptomyces sp. PA03-6a]